MTLPPVEPPYEEEVARLLAKLMPPELGYEPLLLFRVLARNTELMSRAYPMASGLLSKGLLPARDREIVIGRTTARAGAEYEWGVHAVIFGPRVGLDEEFLDALVAAPPISSVVRIGFWWRLWISCRTRPGWRHRPGNNCRTGTTMLSWSSSSCSTAGIGRSRR